MYPVRMIHKNIGLVDDPVVSKQVIWVRNLQRAFPENLFKILGGNLDGKVVAVGVDLRDDGAGSIRQDNIRSMTLVLDLEGLANNRRIDIIGG